MWKTVALASILPVSVFAADFPNYFPPIPSSSGGSLTSGTAINASSISATSIADSGLTSNSIVFTDTNGLLATDTNLRYNSGTDFISSTGVSATFAYANQISSTNAAVPGTATVGTVTATVVNTGRISATFVNATSLSIVGTPSATTTGALIMKQANLTINDGLTLEAPDGTLGRIYRSSTQFRFAYGTRSNDLVIASNGNVGIGGTATTNALTVTGAMNTTGAATFAGAVSTSLSGTGQGYVCVDANGALVRSATPCV